MGYLYLKVSDAVFSEDTLERKAFRKHLEKVSLALRAIEWNDSGDGSEEENELILECISQPLVAEEIKIEIENITKKLEGLAIKMREEHLSISEKAE